MSFFGVYLSAIPKMFWSEYSEKPFFRCISCNVPLLESDLHVVQKRIVGGEAVQEMALCRRCKEKQAEEMSEETRENLTKHMAECFQNQIEEQLGEEDATSIIEIHEIQDPKKGKELLNKCTEFCLVCGKERSECHRYSLAGICRDTDLIVQVTPIGQTPLMVCEECELQMSELISQETKDSWDRFVEEHFDGPPGVELDSPSNLPISF